MENIENWRKAGKIGSICRDYGAKLVKKGASVLEIADKVESKIIDMGADVGFPMNINRNDIASHYIPKKNDPLLLGEDFCNIDVGVSVEGAIADTAVTIDLTGKYKELKKSTEEALNAAMKLLSEDCSYAQIGKAVQETIEGFGYKPIVNLSGHSIEEYNIHAGFTIPNYDNGDDTALDRDIMLAIEPFATEGRGLIKESSHPEIFMQVKNANVRSPIARKVLQEISPRNGLPFAKRWLQTKGAEIGIKELQRQKILQSYPPLVDVDGKMTAQTEHTFYISEKGYECTTRKIDED